MDKHLTYRMKRQAYRDTYQAIVYGPVLGSFMFIGAYLFDGGALGQVLRALVAY